MWRARAPRYQAEMGRFTGPHVAVHAVGTTRIVLGAWSIHSGKKVASSDVLSFRFSPWDRICILNAFALFGSLALLYTGDQRAAALAQVPWSRLRLAMPSLTRRAMSSSATTSAFVRTQC